MEEERPPVNYFDLFEKLPLGETIDLPADVLTPTIVDDMLSSHSTGPIHAYLLKKEGDQGETKRTIWIADGNHRYHTQVRNASFQAQLAGNDFDKSQVMVRVRKIIPDPKNDIRIIWKATDWHD